ncbi:alpha/beta hydrolase [Lonepinella sp. BR2271]|uniref:alpha/beta hydrolase n=1 Tax=Lonepinella sp. BR2271 TaxID=3434550 RepID=UPI003F6DCC1F
MKKTTALLLMSMSIFAYSQSISLQNGDFVKGEFTVTDKDGADLAIVFADKSERWLLQNVVGKKEFVFKAEQTGTADFVIYPPKAEKTEKAEKAEKAETAHYQIQILQQIPVAEQQALPEKYLSPTIQQLAEQLTEQNKAARLDEFWQKITQQGLPLIEPVENSNQSIVTFLWRGAKHNVWLWGSPSREDHHDQLERLFGSDIWFKSYQLPNDSLVSYGFAPDVPSLPVNQGEQRRAILATLQADPFNPHTYPAKPKYPQDRFSYVSALKLKNTPQSPWLKPQNAPQGKLQTHQFHSQILVNSRRVQIYLPAHFEPNNPDLRLLFLFDGTDYIDKVPTPMILDNLIAQGKIPPTVTVFIDNPTTQARRAELPPNLDFAKMIATELYPWVSQQLGIKIATKHTALAGSSFGGLATAYIANQYPDIFGNGLILSGSFWWKDPQQSSQFNNAMAHLYASQATKNLHFFISAGIYEQTILNSSRHFKDVLMAKNYPVIYKEYASEHGYFSWQTILPEGLLALFGQ